MVVGRGGDLEEGGMDEGEGWEGRREGKGELIEREGEGGGR